MLIVHEIFRSIQGESSYAGCPCVFVRLTGCDLRCAWCDTSYAFHGGREISVDGVLREVERHGCGLVEITGGEPLLQEDVYLLAERLLESGCTVLLETGGHLDVSRVPEAVIKVMDVKCPGSGEAARTDWRNLDRLSGRDQVKFVLQDRADYEYAREVVSRHALDRRCGAVLFSPVYGVLEPKTLAGWVLADRLPVRLQLQIHKYIWGAGAQGV